ncbi:MAG: hypothetical protein GVY13_18445 [Alphaproteobacteria bacterium]|jgi:hypothetical protein|nr:hypothetical protein [Alphaproteobacteria bacterium]
MTALFGRRAAALGLLGLAGCVQTAAVDRSGPLDPVDPETLMGRTPAAVLSDLGEPELQRREPPVEVWQYRSDACVFDVYFDEAGDRADPVVVYWEARSRDSGPADPPRCLGDVIAAGRAAGRAG